MTGYYDGGDMTGDYDGRRGVWGDYYEEYDGGL
jgi:hypothetical protein